MTVAGGTLRKHTFCRVCEPACGLVATVEDGELVKLRPDKDHPVTRGFACHKGLAGLDIHHDPDRVNHPLKRTANGTFERISWEQALAEISERLRTIVDTSGPEAVTAYVGNPSAFNSLARPAISRFLGSLGVRETFTSGTQDCMNKFAGSEAVFGSSTIHPIPDLEHTDYLLILGENPAVSHMSFLGIADPMAALRRAKRRGATIRFVDPRRHESARPSVGDVIRIKPDTDLYFLAAVIGEIDRTAGFDKEAIEKHGANIDQLREFIARFPVERASRITGIEADEIRRVAAGFAAAPRASVHMSTGVNMGRQGTLCYWLLHMLSFATGNLDRRGGNVLSEGFYLSAKAGRADASKNRRTTRWGELRNGPLPGNLMAEAILDSEQPMRAMFVVAGNPVLSIAGEEELQRAFLSLELLVCVDIYRSATGELADYVLPSTDMFERPDITLAGLGLQHQPYAQWTDRVVAPRAERREEWWIFEALAQAMGLDSLLDLSEEEQERRLWGRFEHMLTTRGQSLEALYTPPHCVTYGDHQPGRFFTQHIQTETAKVDCCPPVFEEALKRARNIARELEERPEDVLLLITRRDKYSHNSWYANLPKLRPDNHNTTYLYIHPVDASERGLSEGALAKVENSGGKITATVRFDDDLMRGVVAVPHGWGHQKAPGMRVASQFPGDNVNRLLPRGPDSFEPLSSQAHMTGIEVAVSATT